MRLIFWKNKKSPKYTLAEKAQVILGLAVQLIIFVALARATFEAQWVTVFVSALGLAVMWLPSILTRNMRIRIPLEFEFILAIFIYLSLFLGEIRGFYTRFPWWDLLLHGIAGIAIGFIGFLILYTLLKESRLRSSPAIASTFSFAFALAIGALWEIIEFSIDSIFGLNMQKSGLQDTMGDLIVDAFGALLVSLSAYFYLRFKTRGTGIFQFYLERFIENRNLKKKL